MIDRYVWQVNFTNKNSDILQIHWLQVGSLADNNENKEWAYKILRSIFWTHHNIILTIGGVISIITPFVSKAATNPSLLTAPTLVLSDL
jgi:hypothetical protein